MEYIYNKIQNLIKRSYITNISKDFQDYSWAQIKYYGTVKDTQTIYPYGIFSNAPINTLVMSLSVMADESNIASIPYTAKDRFKGLLSGEVVVGSPEYKQYIKFNSLKDIDIVSLHDINIIAQDNIIETIGKNYSIAISNDFSINTTNNYSLQAKKIDLNASSSVNITSPRMSISDGDCDLQTMILQNLDPNKTVVTDSQKKLISGAPTSTELGYLVGSTSNLQDQVDDKEPAISLGLSSQYFRGDKTWQTLDTSVVTENTNIYFTNIRAISSILTGYVASSGSITSADSILSSIEKLGYDKHMPVTLNANSGLILSAQELSVGTPSTITISSTNSVSTSTHSHEISITKSFFYPADASVNYNNRRSVTISETGAFEFNFFVPHDFKTLSKVYVIGYPSSLAAGTNRDIDFTVEYTNSAGEVYNQYTASDTTSLYDLTVYTDRQYRFDITSLFTNLSQDSEGGILVSHNSIGGSINYIGVLIIYD